MSLLARIGSFVALLTLCGSLRAETIVISHLLEQSGSQSQQPGTSESILIFTLPSTVLEACGVSGDVDVNVVWFNPDGTPVRSATGQDLCAPCSYTLGAATPRLVVDLNDIIASKGGYPTVGGDYDGYIVVETSALLPEVEDEVLVTMEMKSWVDTMALPSTSRMKVRPLQDRVVVNATCRSFVVEQLVETAGTVSTASNSDSEIFAVYTDTSPGAADITLDVYLYDSMTGALLTDPIFGAICNPCTTVMGYGVGLEPKVSLRLDDLLTAGGTIPFPGTELDVVAVVDATGGNLDAVSVGSTVTTSRSGPNDISVEMAVAEEIAHSGPTAVVGMGRPTLRLESYPNPFNPRTTLSYTLPSDGFVAVRIADSRGRVVRSIRLEGVSAGSHELVWDGRDDAGKELASGIYFARLQTEDGSAGHKMALIR